MTPAEMMAAAGYDPAQPAQRRKLAEAMELTDRSLISYLNGSHAPRGPAMVLLRHLANGGAIVGAKKEGGEK